MATPTDRFIRILTESHRLVVLGGLAVIAHGLSRSTYNGDVWLEPKESPEIWCDVLLEACAEYGSLQISALPGWKVVEGDSLLEAVQNHGVVRVQGLDCPLDIFRKPNEFEPEDFDEVFRRATLRSDGTRLPDPLDLIQSKLATGRDKDLRDIQFLESVIRSDYKARLRTVSFDEARIRLDRFSEWEVLVEALKNPSNEVKELAMAHLKEFAAAGDPFSQAILEGRELP
jgi:hypothetical protein